MAQFSLLGTRLLPACNPQHVDLLLSLTMCIFPAAIPLDRNKRCREKRPMSLSVGSSHLIGKLMKLQFILSLGGTMISSIKMNFSLSSFVYKEQAA